LEIICIGNELLIGKTSNTNATWLAKHVTSLGLNVERITVIIDDTSKIAEALQESLDRRPKLIITTGGLGPTFDDKTLQGIAIGLNRTLEVNPAALKMLEERYKNYAKTTTDKIELTPARLKMATLPEGAKPLHNPVGTAPGVLLKTDDTQIAALPGVPPEMEAIFEESLAKIVKKVAGKSKFLEGSLRVANIMESTLAPLIDKVMNDNPEVYVKSHVFTQSKVQVEGQKSHIELHFSITTQETKTAKNHLKTAKQQLSKLVQEKGGKISPP
jgi:molybdenum cofactor synthesis domain-containing protein